MNEEKVMHDDQQASSNPLKKMLSPLLVFGLAVIVIVMFGAAGAYLDLRLQQLEQKVLTQTKQVSIQSEDALTSLQTVQTDILENRAETAQFAQKMSSTLQEFSTLLTSTIDSFSQHTSALTAAIDKKDKTQVEFLKSKLGSLEKSTLEQTGKIQAAVETVFNEIASTQTAVQEANSRAETIDQKVAVLTEQVDQMNEKVNAGFASLTDLANELNAVVSARFDDQSKNFATELAALKETSDQSLVKVGEKLAAISREVNQVQTFASESDKALGGDIRSLFAQQTDVIDQSVTSVSDQLTGLTDQMNTGFVKHEESTDIIRADIAQMNYTLTGKSDDLFIEFVDTKKELIGQQEITDQKIGKQIKALNENITLVFNEIDQTNALAASTKEILEQADEKANNSHFGQTQQIETIDALKRLAGDVFALRDEVVNRIDTVNGKIAELLQNPQSKETQQAFRTLLEDFSSSIQNTETKVNSIQNQLSKLNSRLTFVIFQKMENHDKSEKSTQTSIGLESDSPPLTNE